MRKSAAATGSAVFFALAPGVVAGLIPWSLTRWRLGAPITTALPLRRLYLAVTAVILGQWLWLWRPLLIPWAVIAACAMVAFASGYEQPALRRRFGSSYEAYRRAVPGWWPRRRPWHPS